MADIKKYYYMRLNENYFKIAKERIENVSNSKNILK